MKRYLVSLLTGLLVTSAGASLNLYSSPSYAADKNQASDQQPIYGYELMTTQERTEFRSHIRNLKTEQEREQYRLDHHKKMQTRAKERNVNLPEAPMPRGSGMGGGQGMGGGRP